MRSLGVEDTVKAPEEGLKGPAQVSEFPQVETIEDTPGDGGSEGILCPGGYGDSSYLQPINI